MPVPAHLLPTAKADDRGAGYIENKRVSLIAEVQASSMSQGDKGKVIATINQALPAGNPDNITNADYAEAMKIICKALPKAS